MRSRDADVQGWEEGIRPRGRVPFVELVFAGIAAPSAVFGTGAWEGLSKAQLMRKGCQQASAGAPACYSGGRCQRDGRGPRAEGTCKWEARTPGGGGSEQASREVRCRRHQPLCPSPGVWFRAPGLPPFQAQVCAPSPPSALTVPHCPHSVSPWLLPAPLQAQPS